MPAPPSTEMGWMRLCESPLDAWHGLATVGDPPCPIPFEVAVPEAYGELADAPALRPWRNSSPRRQEPSVGLPRERSSRIRLRLDACGLLLATATVPGSTHGSAASDQRNRRSTAPAWAAARVATRPPSSRPPELGARLGCLQNRPPRRNAAGTVIAWWPRARQYPHRSRGRNDHPLRWRTLRASR